MYDNMQLVVLGDAFELMSFLRCEAKIEDEEDLKRYKALLEKNKVNEARLHLLTETMLLKWGIESDLDLASILEAAKLRTSCRKE